MELLEPVAATKKSPINLKKQIGRYLKKWPWILLSVLIFYLAGWLYLRYTNEQYLTRLSVKIENLEKGSLGAIQNMGSVPVMTKQGAEVEIPIILSRPILYDVVKLSNVDVLLTVKGQVKDQRLYQEAPVDVRILSLKDPAQFSSRVYTL